MAKNNENHENQRKTKEVTKMTTDFRALVVKQHPKFEHLPDEFTDYK